METCFAPSFACLFLGLWEEGIFKNEEKYPEINRAVLWFRYIDDLFLIWKGSEKDAIQFIQKLNENDYNIRLTYNISPSSIEFLDTKIEIKEMMIHTELFCKATAGNSLLHATSGHPDKLKWSIQYGELLRAKRISNTDEVFEREQEEMVKRFKQRGYPDWVIKKATDKIKNVERIQTLFDNTAKMVNVNNNEDTRLILTYNEDTTQIKKIISKHWNILKSDPIIDFEEVDIYMLGEDYCLTECVSKHGDEEATGILCRRTRASAPHPRTGLCQHKALLVSSEFGGGVGYHLGCKVGLYRVLQQATASLRRYDNTGGKGSCTQHKHRATSEGSGSVQQSLVNTPSRDLLRSQSPAQHSRDAVCAGSSSYTTVSFMPRSARNEHGTPEERTLMTVKSYK
ncbi:hypothetical protein NDU88_001809 [Pleurodeles waltl]|uniref:Helix-turn-helix domain-containing protein n=1 Tax=Pleurodeles waltl TaxID=8319 RepID=A0AAV7U7W8_PLEWA|nr:hypothetical protein NDU88_001809 [Pleurodeles waltl]